VFPIASSSIDEDTLKAVKLILSNELTEVADKIGDAIRPEIEDSIVTSMEEKLGILSSSLEEKLNTWRTKEADILISERVRLEIWKQRLEDVNPRFGQGIISTVASLIAGSSSPSRATKSRRSSSIDKKDLKKTNDNTSKFFGMFFRKLYSAPSVIASQSANFEERRNMILKDSLWQNGVFAYSIIMFAAICYSMLEYLNVHRGWQTALSIWYNGGVGRLSDERTGLLEILFSTFIAGSAGIIFWGIIGLFGYRLLLTSSYHFYKIFGFSINPDAVTVMFVTSILSAAGGATAFVVLAGRFAQIG
jgi:hypothetical protein